MASMTLMRFSSSAAALSTGAPMARRSAADVFDLADALVGSAEAEATGLTAARDAAETDELETALGAGGAVLGAMLITPVLAGRLEPTGFSLPGVLLSLLGAFFALGLVAAMQRLVRRKA